MSAPRDAEAAQRIYSRARGTCPTRRWTREGAGNLATHVQSSLGLLERSSPEAARVLRQRFFDGRELREMAADLGVSVPTACRRVQAALAEIRGCIELVLL